MSKDDLKKEILFLVEQYAKKYMQTKEFEPGVTSVPPAGKVIGSKELQLMTEAVLDSWLTTGRFNDEFEKRLASFVGVKHAITVSSGSSANLLAVSALTSYKLKERALKAGDEVITVAAGFPTTVNPIIQNGLIPVFIDVEIPTYNIDVSLLEGAITAKTKAIMIAHTLGNPFNLKKIKLLAKKYNLWLIEDCCDALGSSYDNKKLGTFGDIATVSFYPAHHITMGEGGAVLVQSSRLKRIIESFRDWGRDCYCDPGQDNTCKKRFDRQFGSLPSGYDHKYTYTHVGYNLKITDMQAACGLAQLDSLEYFIERRKKNFKTLMSLLMPYEKFLILPKETKNSEPAWFGFPITLRENMGYERVQLLKYLDSKGVGTRLLFAGNLTCQPYFQDLNYRVHGNLENTDRIMNQSFWLGVYPGLGEEHLIYMGEVIAEFFDQ